MTPRSYKNVTGEVNVASEPAVMKRSIAENVVPSSSKVPEATDPFEKVVLLTENVVAP